MWSEKKKLEEEKEVKEYMEAGKDNYFDPSEIQAELGAKVIWDIFWRTSSMSLFTRSQRRRWRQSKVTRRARRRRVGCGRIRRQVCSGPPSQSRRLVNEREISAHPYSSRNTVCISMLIPFRGQAT
jgi:hypothetical protein